LVEAILSLETVINRGSTEMGKKKEPMFISKRPPLPKKGKRRTI
jgi:hypothetical protein